MNDGINHPQTKDLWISLRKIMNITRGQPLKNKRKFFFGRHKGEYIEDVIYQDTQYIRWCLDNVTILKFNEEELSLFRSVEHDIIVQRSKMKNYRKKHCL